MSFSRNTLFILFTFFFCTNFVNAAVIGRPVLNSGLVGYWNFEEGPGSLKTYDRSGFGNTSILTNGPVSTSSKSSLGQALYFDGIDDWASAGNSNFPTGANPRSVSVWIKTSQVISSGTYPLIFEYGTRSTNQNYVIDLCPSNDSNCNNIAGSAAVSQWGNGLGTVTPVNDGLWHHIVTTFDGTNHKIYLDSVLKGTKSMTTSTVLGAQTSISIGASANSMIPFNGLIDEVRVYNRALSGDEVSRLYKIQKPKISGGVDNTSLVGYWPLDEGAGTRAEDASFNVNNATLTGGAWVNGKIGKSALSFNGSSDYLTLPNSLIKSYTNITFSAWFKTSSSGVILGYANAAYPTSGVSAYVPAVYVGTDGKLIGEYWYGSVSPIISSGTVNDNKWHNVILIGNSTTQSMYLDGVFVGSVNGTIDHLSMTTNQIGTGYVGGAWPSTNPNWFFFNGSIDDVRLYSRAFTSTDVSNIYKGGRASVVNKSKTDRLSNGLVGYWTFDGNKLYGTTVYDSGSGGNNGTMTNGPVPVAGKVGQGLSFNGST